MKKRPKAPPTAEEIESRVEELEKKTERLRGLYESFFLGIEKAPPNVPRRELNRLVLEMQQIVIGKATLRFRFQSLLQRWVLYTTYWNRTLREIEAGTFLRDLAKTQRHLADRGGAITEEEALALGIPRTRVKAFMERQNRLAAARGAPPASPTGPAASSTVQPPPPSAAGRRPDAVPGVPDADVEALYRRYTETHRRVNDPRPAMTLDKLRERLRVQIPKILADRGYSGVKLDVDVEDGKVRLKATPVKE